MVLILASMQVYILMTVQGKRYILMTVQGKRHVRILTPHSPLYLLFPCVQYDSRSFVSSTTVVSNSIFSVCINFFKRKSKFWLIRTSSFNKAPIQHIQDHNGRKLNNFH